MIFDRAYFTGSYENPYSKNYSDSALMCLVLKNRADDILKQMNLGIRAYNAAEAQCIADDFEYYYNNYFSREFPSHTGAIILALVKSGKYKDAQKMLDLIVTYREQIKNKRADCEKETQSRGYYWTINWNTGYINHPIGNVMMRDKIIAYVSGKYEHSYIIGNAIIFTQDELVEIGFIAPEFLLSCKKIGIAPHIDEQVMSRLLATDSVEIFDALVSGAEISNDVEKLILNSNGKIKTHYAKSYTIKNFNNVLASGDVNLALSLLVKPKDVVLKLKDLNIELLGSKEMSPVLKKFVPFLEQAALDRLLKDIVPQDNIESRIALLEAGAKVLVLHNGENGNKQWIPDDTQTEILYKLLKSEVK